MANGDQPAKADYTDPATGKPIVYDDAVPALLRGDPALTQEEQARVSELNKLAEVPLNLAARGKDDWNLWVKANHKRWLVQEDKGAHIFVALTPTDGGLWDDDYYRKNGLDFSTGQPVDDKGHYEISQEKFTGFVFPCIVSFKNAQFSGRALFSGAQFSKEALFSGAQFSKEALFDGAQFSGEAWFDEAQFSGRAGFSGAQFSKVAWFDGAQFSGRAGFSGAQFSGEAWFDEAQFSGVVSYQRAVFYGGARWYDSEFTKTLGMGQCLFISEASFENARIKANANFDHVCFGKTPTTRLPTRESWQDDWPAETVKKFNEAKNVDANSITIPNFKGAVFEIAPNLGYTEIPAPPHAFLSWYERFFAEDGLKPGQRKIKDKDASAKLRVLGGLAARGHHQLAEKRFFRAELLTRRGHEATSWRENTMINLFELFSKCGLSFRKPIGWWAVFSVAFGVLYRLCSPRFEAYGHWQDLVSYTLSNSLPIIGIFRSGSSHAASVLYGEAGGLPFIVGLIAGAHNLASTIFLFFALLAVRNYFKLG